jgi:hypothetical protein
MEKNTKILLGVGAIIAAYIILKPKKAVIAANSSNPIRYGDKNNLIYKYKVVKPISFGSGSFSDNTSFNSLAPKVGDIIETNAAFELPKYMAGGGIAYPYQICITPLYHNIQDKECRDVLIAYDALENLGQVIYT